MPLLLTSLRDDRVLGVLDLAGCAASSFDGLDDLHRLRIRNFAEDDVLAVQPTGDDGGDEKLRSVANRNRDVSESSIAQERNAELTCWDQRSPSTRDQEWCAS